MTPLHDACCNGHEEIAVALIDRRADINVHNYVRINNNISDNICASLFGICVYAVYVYLVHVFIHYLLIFSICLLRVCIYMRIYHVLYFL